jgi:competence protein ComEA
LAVAVFFSAGGVWLASRPVPRGVEVIIPSTTVAQPAVVHVTGGVVNPGIDTLPPDARILDAIEAAGGLYDPELPHNLNLAQQVVDGQQIAIPDGTTPTPIEAITSGRSQDGRIDLNSVDAALLEELPGIGEVRAKSIIDWRSTHPPFTSADDLLAIPGIGESTVDAIRPLVSP